MFIIRHNMRMSAKVNSLWGIFFVYALNICIIVNVCYIARSLYLRKECDMEGSLFK